MKPSNITYLSDYTNNNNTIRKYKFIINKLSYEKKFDIYTNNALFLSDCWYGFNRSDIKHPRFMNKGSCYYIWKFANDLLLQKKMIPTLEDVINSWNSHRKIIELETNNTNIKIQYYRWRRFVGIRGWIR